MHRTHGKRVGFFETEEKVPEFRIYLDFDLDFDFPTPLPLLVLEGKLENGRRQPENLLLLKNIRDAVVPSTVTPTNVS